MGANSLVKLIGRSAMFGKELQLDGAVAVSNPFDFLNLAKKLIS
jgi:predicted alpha/beta-fold hydrolase